ncbi:MAG: membrane protein insertion efficiency factor YidD [Dehalococcoidia bacterium]|nr:membrane protein insertion efficiency factor YidD [Dehalococcoidia bacterium]
MKNLTLEMIKLYQSSVSLVMPKQCRFTPTCSQYIYEAIDKFGFFHGSWLGVRRLARCHPLNEGGYDPIP